MDANAIYQISAGDSENDREIILEGEDAKRQIRIFFLDTIHDFEETGSLIKGDSLRVFLDLYKKNLDKTIDWKYFGEKPAQKGKDLGKWIDERIKSIYETNYKDKKSGLWKLENIEETRTLVHCDKWDESLGKTNHMFNHIDICALQVPFWDGCGGKAVFLSEDSINLNAIPWVKIYHNISIYNNKKMCFQKTRPPCGTYFNTWSLGHMGVKYDSATSQLDVAEYDEQKNEDLAIIRDEAFLRQFYIEIETPSHKYKFNFKELKKINKSVGLSFIGQNARKESMIKIRELLKDQSIYHVYNSLEDDHDLKNYIANKHGGIPPENTPPNDTLFKYFKKKGANRQSFETLWKLIPKYVLKIRSKTKFSNEDWEDTEHYDSSQSGSVQGIKNILKPLFISIQLDDSSQVPPNTRRKASPNTRRKASPNAKPSRTDNRGRVGKASSRRVSPIARRAATLVASGLTPEEEIKKFKKKRLILHHLLAKAMGDFVQICICKQKEKALTGIIQNTLVSSPKPSEDSFISPFWAISKDRLFILSSINMDCNVIYTKGVTPLFHFSKKGLFGQTVPDQFEDVKYRIFGKGAGKPIEREGTTICFLYKSRDPEIEWDDKNLSDEGDSGIEQMDVD